MRARARFLCATGAEKALTEAQGLPWERGETFDDYC